MSEIVEKTIRDAFPDSVLESTDVGGILNVKIRLQDLLPICEMLKTKLDFNYLADITAVDWKDRFEVIYQLTALSCNERVALRVDLDHDNPEVDSLYSVWKGADFQEREAFDLMGIVFNGHPNLKRILLPEDWEGYPLRKDYVIPD